MTHNAEKDAPPSLVLPCPKCPRSLIFRRRAWSTYERITPWVMGIARYRCEGCGFECPMTTNWVRDWVRDHATRVIPPG